MLKLKIHKNHKPLQLETLKLLQNLFQRDGTHPLLLIDMDQLHRKLFTRLHYPPESTKIEIESGC